MNKGAVESINRSFERAARAAKRGDYSLASQHLKDGNFIIAAWRSHHATCEGNFGRCCPCAGKRGLQGKAKACKRPNGVAWK